MISTLIILLLQKVLFTTRDHRLIQAGRDLKITESNHKPNTAKSTTQPHFISVTFTCFFHVFLEPFVYGHLQTTWWFITSTLHLWTSCDELFQFWGVCQASWHATVNHFYRLFYDTENIFSSAFPKPHTVTHDIPFWPLQLLQKPISNTLERRESTLSQSGIQPLRISEPSSSICP